MAPDTLTPRALGRATLARQLLLERQPLPATEVVARLAGIQAQDPRPPFVGLWTRIPDFAADELRDALARAAIVRATAMRGTLHLLTADDYLAWRAPLEPVLLAGLRVLGDRAKGLELEPVLAAARELLGEEPRTFGALRELLQERFPEVNERALGFATRMGLPLVMVPTEDRWSFPRDSRFALAEERIGRAPAADDDRRELVRRYLAAFGPASVADAQTWSASKPLKEVFEQLRDELVVFRAGRRELFDLPDAPRPGEDAPAPVRFLPEFDNLLLSHADRTRVIADEHRPHVFSKNLRVRATFLVDGLVAGTWVVERKRKLATLRLTPFAKLTKAVLRDLTREGEPLARFVEPEAEDVAVVAEAPA
ncbi:winged helix DNA-binding domain-containing protein [Patulibacter defluvii]|uniref:winged helix DNA-binding domain-containing protein n=1 Tax=Patulibacter defluvii TaxID=3095358 RepID=UPI002A74F9F6|nr:winged helix DNA-binding domain-containing protein [Patulibacter sp. DM4]